MTEKNIKDDTEFIQHCLDNDLEVPTGVYKISKPVIVHRGMPMKLTSKGRVILEGYDDKGYIKHVD